MKINLNSLKSLNLLLSAYRHITDTLGKRALGVYFLLNYLLALSNKTRLIYLAVDRSINPPTCACRTALTAKEKGMIEKRKS